MKIFLATLATFSLVMALLAWLGARASRCGRSALGNCADDCPGLCGRKKATRAQGVLNHET